MRLESTFLVSCLRLAFETVGPTATVHCSWTK